MVRVRDDVPGHVARVRAFMREHDVTFVSWWLCEHSTPRDLEAQLYDEGLFPASGDYELDGMLLTREPPAGPADIEARRVRNADEYAAARLLQYDVFDSPPDRRRTHAQLVADFEDGLVAGAVYGAWFHGELISFARAFFAPQGAALAGGGTLEHARGRGAYRALVRARWDDIVARGGTALVVQAGALSAPILRRLGFEAVLRFHRLEDVLVPTRARLETLELAGHGPSAPELLVALVWLVLAGFPIGEDELHAARRRALLVLAAGGDPHRELDLSSPAAARLAEELDSPERRNALLSALSGLDADGLPTVAAALAALRDDPELAWRYFALALLADELADE